MIAIQMDRIFSSFYKRPTMSTEAEKLKDQIEDLHLQILDINESRTVLRDMLEARERQIKQQDQSLEECRKVRLEQSAAVARCTALEADLRRLKVDYDICEKNRQHVMTLHQGKEAILKEAMKVTTDLREKAKKSDEYKAQAEHLARQAVRLNEELSQVRTDYVNMMESFKEIKAEFPQLRDDNEKYRAQVTRLLQQQADYDCQKIGAGGAKDCGQCLACQLRQAQAILTQTAENVKKANGERDAVQRRLDSVLDSHGSNEHLIQALSNENNHLKQLNRILFDGLTTTIDCGVFARKGAAQATLKTYHEYVAEQTKLKAKTS